MVIKEIDNGVCAPKGYKAAGIHCGIRKNKLKKDFALIVSEALASAAGVYTSNLVKGAPVIVTKSNLKDGKAQAVVCNSGNANTCNADGIEIAETVCQNTTRIVCRLIAVNAYHIERIYDVCGKRLFQHLGSYRDVTGQKYEICRLKRKPSFVIAAMPIHAMPTV